MRYPIRFDTLYRILSVSLLIAPEASYVEIDGPKVTVRMSWAFRSRFDRGTLLSVERAKDVLLTRGVHGFAGRWLVNGSGQGIVALKFEPVQRAYVLGFPVQLKQLLVSVEDVDGVISALRSP
ncbi:MAG TPA: hypothetical protein VIV60_12450 [Polyangiaceae bacterium]